jgi:inner membrane transporter RhtA
VRPRPDQLLAAVALGWGSLGVVVREVDLAAVGIVAARVGVASLAIGAWLLWRRPPGARPFTVAPGRVVVLGLLLAGHWVSLFAALQRAPIGTVLLITYLSPVLVAVVAPRTLGERVDLRTAVALFVALVGTVLVAGPGAEGVEPAGLVLAGLAAVSYAAITVAGKALSASYGGLTLAWMQLTVASVVLLPIAAATGTGWPASDDLAWLLVLGLGYTAFGLGVWFLALGAIPATHVGILGYLEPAGAVVFGWLLLGETPGAATLVGGVAIAAAGLSVLRRATVPVPATPEVTGAPS